MIKPELYNKTVGILYDAYFNDTLEHLNCYACAVGNLVAANMGQTFMIDESLCDQKLYWQGFTSYATGKGLKPSWSPLIDHIENSDDKEIASTGYSVQELIRIEDAFENEASLYENGEDEMFNGLVAVLEVLEDIHQVTDEDLLQANNKRFKDHYAKRTGATV